MIMNNFKSIAAALVSKGYTVAGTGSKRCAYVCPEKKHVIKIPVTEIGIMENFFEDKKFKSGAYPGKVARCMLVANNLVIMEYVEPVVLTKETVLPYWCKEFDNQVGYNKKGQLVAYDYGC
jgi:hypothetical protein